MVFIAVANGAIREAWLTPRLGELQSRQISTLLLLVFFALYIWFVVRLWPIGSSRQALTIGLAWLALTLLFEFALGRVVSGVSWREMFAEYDLTAGRLWVLIPLWVAMAPYVFYQLRRNSIGP
jgi:hypothetical protein